MSTFKDSAAETNLSSLPQEMAETAPVVVNKREYIRVVRTLQLCKSSFLFVSPVRSVDSQFF